MGESLCIICISGLNWRSGAGPAIIDLVAGPTLVLLPCFSNRRGWGSGYAKSAKVANNGGILEQDLHDGILAWSLTFFASWRFHALLTLGVGDGWGDADGEGELDYGESVGAVRLQG